MRFLPMPRYEEYRFTDRKRRAFGRKLLKEQERFPLLAAQIAEEQHSADEEERIRIAQARATDQRMRNLQARQWRDVRAKFYALPDLDRAEIRAHWMKWSGPANPSALHYLIRVHTGEYQARVEASRAEFAAIRASLQIPDQDALAI